MHPSHVSSLLKLPTPSRSLNGSLKPLTDRKLSQTKEDPRPISTEATEVDASLRVALRCRPFTLDELHHNGRVRQLQVDSAQRCVSILPEQDSRSQKSKDFTFDWVYDEKSKQSDVYEDIGAPAVESAFNWFNSTIFAYGQTGSGKTHSMLGDATDGIDGVQRGLIPRVVEAVFDRVAAARNAEPDDSTLVDGVTSELVVKCSYIEIYQEVLVDLLVDAKRLPSMGTERLKIRNDPNLGVYVQNATETEVESAEEVMALMRHGSVRRRVGAHSLNERSSRSHAIFTLKLFQVYNADGRRIPKRVAKINLVDLAGSERQKETHAEGVRLQESAAINKSLHTLQRVLRGLVSRHSVESMWLRVSAPACSKKAEGTADVAAAVPEADHAAQAVVPFRESKLTRLLDESLGGGGAFCCMLACLSPAVAFLPQSLSTLRYASGARTIRNMVRRNADITEAAVLRGEVAALQAQLSRAKGGQAEAAYQKKIAGLMCIIDQASKEQRERLAVAEQERTAAAAQLPLPARAALALRFAGNPEAAAELQALQAELTRAEAGYHQQRRLVMSMEEALRGELDAQVGSSEAPAGDPDQRSLERIHVRLRTVQAESCALGEMKKGIREMYERMTALAEQETERLQRSSSGSAAAAREPGEGGGEDEGAAEGVAGSAAEDSGEEEEDLLDAVDRVEAEGEVRSPEEAAAKLLGEVREYCSVGLERIHSSEAHQGQGGDAEGAEGGRKGIPMALLMAFVDGLPDSDGAEGEDGKAAGGGVGGAGMELSASMRSARLAWGDTRAIDCAGYALDRISVALEYCQRCKAVELQALLGEQQALRAAAFRLEAALETRDAELQEATAGAEEAHDSLDQAHQDLHAMQQHLVRVVEEAKIREAAVKLEGEQACKCRMAEAAEQQQQQMAEVLQHQEARMKALQQQERERERVTWQLEADNSKHQQALVIARLQRELEQERTLRELADKEVGEWKERWEAARGDMKEAVNQSAVRSEQAGEDQASLRAQIQALTAELATSTSSHQGAINQLAELQTQHAALRAEHEQTGVAATGLQKRVDALMHDIAAYEESVAAEKLRWRTAEEERAAAEREAARAAGQLLETRQAADEVRQGRVQHDAELAAAQMRLESLSAQEVENQNQLAKIREELAYVKGLKMAEERERERLSEKVERAETLIEEKEEKCRETLASLHLERDEAARLKEKLEKALEKPEEKKSKACVIM
ncbi:hypothetical protein CYMTET_23356 [Cymbomonas tetramitiformis]|uniref:Kinesin motor domain-containing protein n=1 Tax=Cymbomonas tetramitiformis TaxID=36881 RepID=A0AAE0FY44_9CHLO|nr:hypothetical protein CYMTET_23356 [Cymbomonas tetramitiformis]